MVLYLVSSVVRIFLHQCESGCESGCERAWCRSWEALMGGSSISQESTDAVTVVPVLSVRPLRTHAAGESEGPICRPWSRTDNA